MNKPKCFGANCIGIPEPEGCSSCEYRKPCDEEMMSFIDFEFSGFNGTYAEYLEWNENVEEDIQSE